MITDRKLMMPELSMLRCLRTSRTITKERIVSRRGSMPTRSEIESTSTHKWSPASTPKRKSFADKRMN